VSAYEYKEGDDFRNIAQALWLVTAFLSEPDTPMKENKWLTGEFDSLLPKGDAVEVAAASGRMLNGFALLSAKLVNEVASATGKSRDEVLAVYRRFAEDGIAAAEG
jgi:hypothetical protein